MRRYVLTTMLVVFEVILSFAIIIFFSGSSFCNDEKIVTDSLTAVYVSVATFFTLGYGDYVPIDNIGVYIVVSELCFFALFLLLKLPIAIAAIKVEKNSSNVSRYQGTEDEISPPK